MTATCPYCKTTILIELEETWHNCPACHGLIRLHRTSSRYLQLEAGTQNATEIIVNRSVPPKTVTDSHTTSSQSLRTQPPSAQPLRPASPPAASGSQVSRPAPPVRSANAQNAVSSSQIPRSAPPRPPRPNPATMLMSAVRAERESLANEVTALNTHIETLLVELNEFKSDSTQVSAISAAMAAQSRRRTELLRRDDALKTREDELRAQQARAQQEAADQRTRVSQASYSSSSSSSETMKMTFGISAVAGLAGMIGFALYLGIQWEFQTVLVMLGIGLGIAIISWLMGLISR